MSDLHHCCEFGDCKTSHIAYSAKQTECIPNKLSEGYIHVTHIITITYIFLFHIVVNLKSGADKLDVVHNCAAYFQQPWFTYSQTVFTFIK